MKCVFGTSPLGTNYFDLRHSIEAVYLALRWDYLWLTISYYHHNAAVYGQNKHAHANLRRIVGLELAARVVWGLIQPRTAQGGRETIMAG